MREIELPFYKKTILHLCADIGSDSRYYQLSEDYNVIMIGEEVGVENYHPQGEIHGIIANPVCTEFQTINGYGKVNNTEKGMFLVNHCLRIVEEANPSWWVMENPARGELRKFIGEPKHVYQPWHYGSPWTKSTALWGEFNMPPKKYSKWDEVKQNKKLYKRPGRNKPNLAFLHKSAIEFMPEYQWCRHKINCDADLRSLCSDGFARDFFKSNQ